MNRFAAAAALALACVTPAAAQDAPRWAFAIHGGLVTSPTEWQLAAALLVTVALLAGFSLALAWLARRMFFAASPRAKRYFWIIAASAMTAAEDLRLRGRASLSPSMSFSGARRSSPLGRCSRNHASIGRQDIATALHPPTPRGQRIRRRPSRIHSSTTLCAR